MSAHRKWSARILIAGEELAAEPAPNSDTLAATARAAEQEAAALLRAGRAGEARVLLYKRLKGWEEPRHDRQGAYLWLEAGRVMVQR